MDVIEKLRELPWLELDHHIDIDLLRKEYDAVSAAYEFHRYETKYKLVRNYYSKSWSGIGLISTDGELYTDLHEGDIVRTIEQFKPTEAAKLCPYTMSLMREMNGGEVRTRVRYMRIDPKRSLLWHSHVIEHGQPPYIITVQIPIYMPEEFDYCVIDSNEFKWYKRFYKPNWFKSLKCGKLPAGKAYYFNSFDHHNVYNRSNEVRSTLMVYFDLREPYVRDMVERSIINHEQLIYHRV